MQLHFEAVTKENRRELEALEPYPEQSGYIEPVKDCLREADELTLWRPVGIYDGDVLIGFAMYGYFREPAPGQLWLDRLLIGKNYQGRGYGKCAVLALLERLRLEYRSDKVYLSVYEDNKAAVRLYLQVGFQFNGGYDTKGERVMVCEMR